MNGQSDVLFYAGVVGFCLGIVGAIFVAIELIGIIFILLLSLAVSLVWRHGRTSHTQGYTLLISVVLFTFALGSLRVVAPEQVKPLSVLTPFVDSDVTLEGVIVREPDRRERTQHLYVETDNETILVIVDRFGQYEYGQQLAVSGELNEPEAFTTELGRTFNYPGYLKARGVEYMMLFPEISSGVRGTGNSIVSTLLSFKQRFMNVIESLIPEPAVGLGEGLLLGVKQALGDELEEVFRKTGIIHIVVLSGYNVSLVVIFVMYVLSYLFPFRARLAVGVVAIVCFALLVGLSATVVRASLMAAFILLAKYTGRTYAIMRALMVAGVIMLLFNPYLLPYDVGFQLSFLATMGLILLAPHLERFAGFMPTTIGLREFLVATVATQLFVMPLLLYQIGEFSVVSVLVNVLVLPMVPVAMFLTFITGLIGFVSLTAALPVAFLAQLSLQYILFTAEWFARLPFAAYVVPPFPFWLVPILYAGIGYILWRLSTNANAVVAGDDLRDWTIESEEALRTRLTNTEDTSAAVSRDSVFFR